VLHVVNNHYRFAIIISFRVTPTRHFTIDDVLAAEQWIDVWRSIVVFGIHNFPIA
jgi:hypothetical protein